jgi:hypothetical protein
LFYTSALLPEEDVSRELLSMAFQCKCACPQLFNLTATAFEYSRLVGIGLVSTYEMNTEFLSLQAIECMQLSGFLQ